MIKVFLQNISETKPIDVATIYVIICKHTIYNTWKNLYNKKYIICMYNKNIIYGKIFQNDNFDDILYFKIIKINKKIKQTISLL